MGHVALVVIAGTTILVPYLSSQVTATHLKIGRLSHLTAVFMDWKFLES